MPWLQPVLMPLNFKLTLPKLKAASMKLSAFLLATLIKPISIIALHINIDTREDWAKAEMMAHILCSVN
jgi:hypothetical protein